MSSYPSVSSDCLPLPCCVEGPPHVVPKARYALETLLLGLGLTPRWCAARDLAGDGLYYGPSPPPTGAVRLRLLPETADFFSAPLAYTRTPETLPWDGDSWSLLFGREAETDGVLEADVVASTFFWLSGWQEHATRVRDRHGRFPYSASLQTAWGIETSPLVDVYRAWLGDRLRAAGVTVPGRTWDGQPWAVALTHDVDAVRTRRLGRFARGLRAGRPGEAFGAFARGDARRDTLVAFHRLTQSRGATATYFFKAGATAPEDLRYRLDAPAVRRLFGRLRTDGFEVGLHPSYHAFAHRDRLAEERDRLADAWGEPPESVRTHFLRWADPATPRLLADAGFRMDSTLGFSQHEGFRRATCTPFRLYDLAADRPLDLWELPLAVMDTTLLVHRGLTQDDAFEATRAVLNAARRVGGCAVLLWHNEGRPHTDDSVRLLTRVLDNTLENGAYVGSLERVFGRWCARAP